ncbi:hypothetical protein IQ266_05055 [filamentous cyanobacterium LEGE 11480]|uniref:Uncharacterized protein n=1 Tax=Romeriopsis navalis LEGE 11480 TaxID=2777977 RepID=A0A928VIU3_9CYAN|nr:hypothetical protein [Romeriopsis navalis LEGE 11480]
MSVEQETRFERYSGYEPGLMQAARKIYRTFIDVHPDVTEEPLGVAIDRYSLRGKLIFTRIPALLPQETFIPFEAIDR